MSILTAQAVPKLQVFFHPHMDPYKPNALSDLLRDHQFASDLPCIPLDNALDALVEEWEAHPLGQGQVV